jgi:hypothetical protein
MNEEIIRCSKCGAELSPKELLTMGIYGVALCDICVGDARRRELIIENYEKLLETVPIIYAATKYSEEKLLQLYKKSVLLTAEISIVNAAQMGRDLIKLYWRKGEEAKYVSAQDISIQYKAAPWQQKPDHIENYALYGGFLVIEGIDNGSDRELMARIMEPRTEGKRTTMIITPLSLDALAHTIGSKAADIISANWAYLELDGNG